MLLVETLMRIYAKLQPITEQHAVVRNNVRYDGDEHFNHLLMCRIERWLLLLIILFVIALTSVNVFLTRKSLENNF